MRWLVVSVIVGAALALLAVPFGRGQVSADNPPHVAGAGVTADSCAGCHRAHTAQAANLLTDVQPGLCYTCHGTGGSGSELNVQDGKVVTGGAALRGGGFDYAMIRADDPRVPTPPAHGGGAIGVGASEAVTSRHSNDGTAGTVWGYGAINSGAGVAFSLRCGSCHDPHGNGQYRILRTDPAGTGTTPQPTVAVADSTPEYSTTDYFDVSYPGVSDSDLAKWCSNCHTRYLAGAGSYKTPTADSIFTYRHASDASSYRPECIKCHVAHGTNATTYADAGAAAPGYSAGVEWPDGATPEPTPNSNSRLLKMDNRGICTKCHSK